MVSRHSIVQRDTQMPKENPSEALSQVNAEALSLANVVPNLLSLFLFLHLFVSVWVGECMYSHICACAHIYVHVLTYMWYIRRAEDNVRESVLFFCYVCPRVQNHMFSLAASAFTPWAFVSSHLHKDHSNRGELFTEWGFYLSCRRKTQFRKLSDIRSSRGGGSGWAMDLIDQYTAKMMLGPQASSIPCTRMTDTTQPSRAFGTPSPYSFFSLFPPPEAECL